MEISKARQKYVRHKHRAARRGVAFELTFEQWLAEWGDKLDRVGRHRDQFGMCRVMDKGGYAVGNVYIGTPKRNAHTRVIVNAQKYNERVRNQQEPEPPVDSDWEEDNPWLPEEFKPRNAWSWGHREY